jgi:hypothetical protein
VAKQIGRRTITVIRAPKVDRLSEDEPTPTEHDIDGCAVLPRTSFEQDRGWVVVEGRQIFAPYGADVLADDKVRVDDAVWEVDGAPGDYEDRKARGKATILYLKRLGT